MADVTAGPCKTLAEALAALQARLPRVAKTADAQHGKYADLAVISEALLPVLASLGLSFSAKPTLLGDKFVLHYILRHTSGQSDEGFYPLPGSGSPQQVGGAITYARRYTLCAVTGLAPRDDANEVLAADIHAEQQQLRQPVSSQDKERAKTTRLKAGTSRMAQAQEQDPWAQDGPVDGQRAAQIRGEAEQRPGSSNPSQWQQLVILYGQLGITERDTRLAEMTDRVGRSIGSAKDLSYAEAVAAIRSLRDLAATEKGSSDA
jgi:hypothetical protein